MRKESRRALCLLLLFVSATHGFVQVGTAQNRQAVDSQHRERLLRDVRERFGPGWTVRLSADGRRVESMVGPGAGPYRGEPPQAAGQFLRENGGLFGLRPDLSDLKLSFRRSSPGGGSVEFQQFIQDLPVDNAHVQVNLDKAMRVVQVVNSYAPPQDVPSAATVSREQAVEFAVSEFLRSTPENLSERTEPQRSVKTLSRAELQLKAPPSPRDTYFVKDGRLRRAYRVHVVATRPHGSKEFIIDANTGEVLDIIDHIRTFADATGQVFIPNPVNSLNDNTLTATSSVPTTNPNPYYTVPLLNLGVPSAGPYTLQGPFAVLQDIVSPANTPPTETSPSFSYVRTNPNFYDVMVYYTIDRMQRYIQSLGFVDVNNRQQRADSNTADSSSYYDSTGAVGSGYIAYATNLVPAGEDGDVIAHEYGHAIQDNQTNGKYSHNGQSGAMGEGFSDYWAVSTFFNETQASGHDQPCVGEWRWNSNPTHCLRRVDGAKTFDDYAPGAGVHANGEIWSRALWDMLNALGKTTSDRLVLQSHFNVPSNPTFKTAADAVLTADLQLYSGSHLTQLCTVFTDRRIYNAGDCPTVPASTGAQNTLVVLARFNEAGLPASPVGAGDVTALVNNINSYLAEVAYGQATLTPNTQGWIDLPHSRAQYYDQTAGNMLIDMAQDVVAALPAVNFAAVDRMLILTNDDGTGNEARGLKEWATTGPWPYALPAAFGTRRLSVSVHRADLAAADIGQFTHAIGHHFRLGDLYPHEGVTFPRRYADGWGNMAKTVGGAFNNSHFFAADKLIPSWLSAADPAVHWIPHPGAGATHDNASSPVPLFRQESNASNPVLIQIGTTNGVADRAAERVSYFIEARKKAGPFDNNIPADGVLIYYLNRDIAQGFGPLRLVDATPADDSLDNAAFRPAAEGGVGTVSNIDGTGLTVEVLPKTGAEDYRIHVTYSPPADRNDVWINPHDGYWRSQDIWIDSPSCNGGVCGYDAVEGRSEEDRGDKPAACQAGSPCTPPVNRVYARVYNHGPGVAHDVRVDFWLSDPWHAIDGGTIDPDTGGNVAFNKHFFKVIPTVPAGGAGVPVFVEWAPESVPAGTNVHSCVKVKVAQVFNDTNAFNQASQENLDSYDISSQSPYPPVVNPFRVVNPYDHPILVYLRADDVPVGWTADIVPRKAYLPVGGSVEARTTIQAPIDYPVCSTEFIKTSAWYPSGDTLLELGASTAQVNLKKSTALTLNTTYGACDRNRSNGLAMFFVPQSSDDGRCGEIVTKGCTNPVRPFEHITVQYTDAAGHHVYHDVVTDANGCFEDFLVNPQGGIWQARAEYPGDDCASSAGTSGTPIFVPPGGFQGGGGGGRGPWFSFHLGMNFPAGSFNRTHEPGPSMTLNAEFPIRERFSLVGYGGFHYFHGDAANPNTHYTNLSLNARWYFPVSNFRGYVEGGPGVYFPKSGPNKFGMNFGAGFSFPINQNLKLELGPDVHFVDPSGRTRTFVDARVGVAFRF